MAARLTHLRADAARLLPLVWPVLVGQLAMVAFGTIDTVLAGRASAGDLAALAVGAAAYLSVFIGLMGVVMGLAPIVGQQFGAGRHAQAGRQVHQAVWLALGLALLGDLALLFPQPFLAIARVSPEVALKVRLYLAALALSLPAALLFTVYRAFNNAIGQPRAVMRIQLLGLGLKGPLSALLVFGWPAAGVPALGVLGCGVATVAAMWLQLALAWRALRRDAHVAPFALLGRGLDRPRRAPILEQLRIGGPSGLAIMVEVTAFAFMSIFIARLGTVPVAGHQIAFNLVSLLFMVPMSIGIATSMIAAQRIGAGDAGDARRISLHGLALGSAAALVLGGVVFAARQPLVGLYTGDAAVAAIALALMAWLVLFHLVDAVQVVAASALRAYKVVVWPAVVYTLAMWGLGLGGGYLLGFDIGGGMPPALHGPRGFWVASTVGLTVVALALAWLLAQVSRERLNDTPGAPGRKSAP